MKLNNMFVHSCSFSSQFGVRYDLMAACIMCQSVISVLGVHVCQTFGTLCFVYIKGLEHTNVEYINFWETAPHT